MIRFCSLCLFALLWAMPVFSQPLIADPTVWVSTSFGTLSWARDVTPEDRDNVISSFSLTAASPRWIVQGGAQVSGDLTYFGWDDAERSTYRSLYAIGGPYASSRWFMGGVAVGPALTWGRRVGASPGDCYDNFCTLIGRYESEQYLNPGFAGSVQGFVRLDGRVWIGGETMMVANRSSTHLAQRAVLRIDLLRPTR